MSATVDNLFRAAQRVGIAKEALHQAFSDTCKQETDILPSFLLAAHALTTNETIGLQLAREMDLILCNPVIYLMLSSSDLETALKCLVHNSSLIVQRYAHIKLIKEHGDILLTYGNGSTSRHFADFAGALMVRLSRMVVHDTGLQPVRACFIRKAPSDTRPWKGFFGQDVSFEAPSNTLVFSAAQIALPSPHACSVLHVAQEAVINRLCSTLSGAMALRQVRDHLEQHLNDGVPSLANSARQLAITPRTLQRQLRSQGTSYRTLLEDVRRARALELVRTTDIPFPSIARAIGFANVSAFYRVFKDWYGQTPTRLRLSTSEDEG